MLIITGTPGTGKTTVARLLAKRLGLPLIEVNKLVKQKKLFSGRERGSLVVKLPALKRELNGFKGIAEGHVLCEFSLPAQVVVLRASPRSIKRRLAKRNYSRQKLRDNIEAEALDYCAILARKNYKKVIDVDTTGLAPPQAATKVLRCLGKSKGDRVDWSSYFLNSRMAF